MSWKEINQDLVEFICCCAVIWVSVQELAEC